jgi:flagellar biosynthesis protein
MSKYKRQAIALAYGKHPAPVITAKGDDDIAKRMLQEAAKHGVFVSEDPQLLALLSRLNLGEEVPEELYTAVAVVLSWVYWLKGMRPGEEKSETQTS